MGALVRGKAVHEFNNSTLYTASTTWTVPAGVTRIRMSGTGGGGGYCSANPNPPAGNGYAAEKLEMSVTPGQTITIVVGAAGAANGVGGSTTVSNGVWTITMRGGAAGYVLVNAGTWPLVGVGGAGWMGYGVGNGPLVSAIAGAVLIEW